MKVKALWIALICLLTLYAPVELTCYIVDYGLDLSMVGELAFMWVTYLAAIVILTKVVKV